MKALINYQESYSRSELLIRSFFGFIYILIPHGFLLFFVGIWGAILSFLTFWVVLFTGRFPESWFDFQLKYQRWNWRLNARIFNMADEYPAFGLEAEDRHTVYEVPYNENPDRVYVLMRALFGWLYVLIPHGIILALLNVVVSIFAFLAWWIVLFTGSYPKSMFDFNLQVLQWGARVNVYMAFMSDTYPPFSLNPEQTNMPDDGMDYDADDDNDENDDNTDYRKEDLV
jgi:hypothetical protein